MYDDICKDCGKKKSDECFHCPVVYMGLQDDETMFPHEVIESERFPF